ncbi:MAG: family 16 glycoside hydrolase [Pirellulales bacterium]
MSRLLFRILFALSALWPASLLAQPTTEAPASVTPVPREGGWLDRHESFNKLAKQGDIDVVFLGDSITQGWEGAGKEAWDAHFAKRKAANFGISGDQTQHVLWRLQNGNLEGINPKLFVIMIGTNNLPDGRSNPSETAAGVTEIVELLRKEMPDSKILLLGIFPRGEKPDDPIRGSVAAVNQEIAQLADWENVHFLDIGPKFTEADGRLDKSIMPDFLHLSPAGYERWADALEVKVGELLGEPHPNRVSLFDGKTLNGWVAPEEGGPPTGWDVVDGALTIVGRGDDALSTQKFEDFDFECDWKVCRRGNSGIFYRVADYKYILLGPEYQLIDEVTRRIRPTDKSATGANVDLFGPLAHKPICDCDQWHHSRIVAVGPKVEHWLNGVRVLTYEFGSPEWQAQLADSKFRRLTPFGELREGAFKLQNKAGYEAQFRDLVVRKL